MKKIIECVINVSEGKNQQVIEAIVNPVKKQSNVMLMNIESDADYHRTVISMLGESEALYLAVLETCENAIDLIDMNVQQGVHPRIGAVDVVPFIPIQNASIEDCIQLANRLSLALAASKNIPIFLYAEAATQPDHVHLSSLRKMEYEGLGHALEKGELVPDVGPSSPHPTAGAIAIGARFPLIAYNVDVASSDVAIAKRIAKQIRESDGGFLGIKAKGVYLASTHSTQVTINITNYHQTSIETVFDAVVELSHKFNTKVVSSEIIGLIPKEALAHTSEQHLKLKHSLEGKILDDYISQFNPQEKEG